MALLHWNGKFGHSGTFAMFLDGDGSEELTVTPAPQHKNAVDCIAGVGYDVEIAQDDSYTGLFTDRSRKSSWIVKDSTTIYERGEPIKTIPSKLYEDED